MEKLTLAIDPGTHRTGVALFAGESLRYTTLIAPPKGFEVEERIAFILDQLGKLAGSAALGGTPIGTVAIERPTGIDTHRPAPELQTLVRRLQRWAKRRPHRWKFHTYHPSTVFSAVHLRGWTGPRKEQLARGVAALYGAAIPADAPEDVIDAVAVGHCHVTKTREAALEGRV